MKIEVEHAKASVPEEWVIVHSVATVCYLESAAVPDYKLEEDNDSDPDTEIAAALVELELELAKFEDDGELVTTTTNNGRNFFCWNVV